LHEAAALFTLNSAQRHLFTSWPHAKCAAGWS